MSTEGLRRQSGASEFEEVCIQCTRPYDSTIQVAAELQTQSPEVTLNHHEEDVLHEEAKFMQSIVTMCGKEDGVFCSSVVAAQLAALKTHSQALGGIKYFALHANSPLERCDGKGYEHVIQMSSCFVGEPYRVLTYNDVINALDATAIHAAKGICVLVIDMPQDYNGGLLPSWEDLTKIREWANNRGVFLHADAARLWECKTYYDRPYSDICHFFDSVCIGFDKCMPTYGGVMLLGDKDFIQEARVWIHRLGGFPPHLTPYIENTARVFEKYCDLLPSYLDRLKEIVGLLTKELTDKGYAIRFVPDVPITSKVLVFLRDAKNVLEASRDAVQQKSGVVLFHEIEPVPVVLHDPGTPMDECFFALNIGANNAAIENSVYLKAWIDFFECRHQIFSQQRFNKAQ